MCTDHAVADGMLLSLFRHEATDRYKRTVTYATFKVIEANKRVTKAKVTHHLSKLNFSAEDIETAISALQSVFNVVSTWTNVKIKSKREPPVHLNVRKTSTVFDDWAKQFLLDNPSWNHFNAEIPQQNPVPLR